MAKRPQRRSRVGWLAGLFLLQFGLALFEGSSAVGPGAAPRDLRLTRLADGSSATLRELAGGRPLLLVFWTTWCAYCSPELERGVALAAELAAGVTPVELLFVNVREPAAVVGLYPHVGALGPRIVLDEGGALAATLGIRGYPAYGLLDSQGGLRWVRHGLEVDVVPEVRAVFAGDDRG